MALTSLGRHEPPYPIPGYRNLPPILSSDAITERTCEMLAPVISQKRAISFTNDMRVASIAFEAYFAVSDERMEIEINLSLRLI